MKLKIPATRKKEEYEIEIKKDTVSAIIDAVLYDSRISSLIKYLDTHRPLAHSVALAGSGGILKQDEISRNPRKKLFKSSWAFSTPIADYTDINKRELAPFSYIHTDKQEGKRPVFALLDILEDFRGREDFADPEFIDFIDKNPDVVPNYSIIKITRKGMALLERLNYARFQAVSDFLSSTGGIKSAMLAKLNDVNAEKKTDINVELSILRYDHTPVKSAAQETLDSVLANRNR